MEHFSFVPGYSGQRSARQRHQVPDNSCRLCTLADNRRKVLGIGDASGMLPINPTTNNYSAEMVAKFNNLIASKEYSWKLEDILPKVLSAGENAGVLTPEGCKKLDASGHLKAGIPVCPPEGDAGTGMVATNAVKQRTGNVSAGTSSFL